MKKLVVLAAVLLSGCAMSPMNEMIQGKKVDTDKFNEFKVCETTKDTVISSIGEPQQMGRQSGYNTVSWYYGRVSFSSGSETQNVLAFFNNENVLVDYAINPVGLVEIVDKCN